jgi:uncharacterized RDD family membrane protein YckC
MEIEYNLASIPKRFVALAIDNLLIVFICRVLTFSWHYDFSSFFFIYKFAGVFFIIALIYYSYFESSESQATLGKRVMNLKVFDKAGNRLTAGKAVVRNIIKIICGNYFLLGFFIALLSEKKQTLHDIISDTVVVEDGIVNVSETPQP